MSSGFWSFGKTASNEHTTNQVASILGTLTEVDVQVNDCSLEFNSNMRDDLSNAQSEEEQCEEQTNETEAGAFLQQVMNQQHRDPCGSTETKAAEITSTERELARTLLSKVMDATRESWLSNAEQSTCSRESFDRTIACEQKLKSSPILPPQILSPNELLQRSLQMQRRKEAAEFSRKKQKENQQRIREENIAKKKLMEEVAIQRSALKSEIEKLRGIQLHQKRGQERTLHREDMKAGKPSFGREKATGSSKKSSNQLVREERARQAFGERCRQRILLQFYGFGPWKSTVTARKQSRMLFWEHDILRRSMSKWRRWVKHIIQQKQKAVSRVLRLVQLIDFVKACRRKAAWESWMKLIWVRNSQQSQARIQRMQFLWKRWIDAKEQRSDVNEKQRRNKLAHQQLLASSFWDHHMISISFRNWVGRFRLNLERREREKIRLKLWKRAQALICEETK